MIIWKICPVPDSCAMWPGDNPQVEFIFSKYPISHNLRTFLRAFGEVSLSGPF
jgi:hypothetical protein